MGWYPKLPNSHISDLIQDDLDLFCRIMEKSFFMRSQVEFQNPLYTARSDNTGDAQSDVVDPVEVVDDRPDCPDRIVPAQ